MAHILLGLLILTNVFSTGFCRQFQVHYEVKDFGVLAEASFKIRHGIAKRSLSFGNSSSTANPISSVMTTPIASTNTTTSVNNATTSSLPTARPAGTTANSKSTDQATALPSTSAKTPLVTTSPTTRFPSLPTTSGGGPTHFASKGNITSNTTVVVDHHDYFKSHYYPAGERWWFDLNNGSGTAKLHDGLTKNLQYSDTIKTTFKFPYYGHEIAQVTITNKGFLFLGKKLHKFNASMQYVAPLMANFGAHLNEKTSIRYVDTGDRFTVEWKNIILQNQQAGEFSFQCSVLKNGTIVFAYKKIPVAVSKIRNTSFPVRVGLSDSYLVRYISRPGIYIINGNVYFRIRYFVYYLYHQVKLPQNQVKSGSAFVMTPLPNCVVFKTCDSCVNSKTQFSCKWCQRLQRCSDGIDRHRESWLHARCDKNSTTTCPRKPSSTADPNQKTRGGGSRGGSSANKRAGIAVVIVFCLLILVALAFWIAYAYTHPLSKSGMFLMQYGNPRKWCRTSGPDSSAGSGKTITFKSMSHDSTA